MPRARLILLAGALAALSACSAGPAVRAAPTPSGPATPQQTHPAGRPPFVGAPVTPSAAPPAALAWRSCGTGFQCADLPVPLGSTGRTVTLALTRLRAAGPGDRIGSLVVNPGGPGASAVDFLQAAATSVPAEVRTRFDLVAFDPRGVGHSAPVRCLPTAGLDHYFALDPVPDDAAELAAYERGNAELVQGCAARSGDLLPYVGTAEAAEDLERVRVAVGDDRLSYLGYSYGTAIGAAYLQAHPTRVRAMVLDGALDPALTWDRLLTGQAVGFDQQLAAFLADCGRPGCAFRQAVRGDLGAAYDALAARVDKTPLPAARPVGPGELTLAVGAALYSRSAWPRLAQALADAERGDGSALLALSDGYLERTAAGYANTSEANLAVNCLDRPWPRDTAAYLALADRLRTVAPRFGPAIALSGLACRTWPVPPEGTPHPVAAPGSPPVLVIGTTGDPATPYAWSVSLARQLSGGVLLTHRGDGHTVYRVGAPACVTGPVDRYLLTAAVPAPETC